MTEDIKVTFIIPKDCKDENECSEEMQLAFIACEQHQGGGLHVHWVHETEWNQFEGLTKKDVFVLSEFEGDMYQKLKATKCLLVGPRCLSCCLTEGAPIPSGSEPIFTVAMRGLVVTASGLSKDKKEEVKKKVQWMGGLYNTVLTDATTHLVSNTVLSDKYIKAVEKGIPVMSMNWIDAVWNASLQLNVNGSSSDFNEHRLLTFANLQVTTTGLTKKDKQTIMKLVNENGGMFSGTFQSETTDVLILTKEGMGSEKYKAAVEYRKACLLPSWIKDSVSKGIALPLTRYRIVGASTSSPLTEHRPPDMSLNFSRITSSRPPSSFVDETKSTDMSILSSRMKLSQETKKYNDLSGVDKDIHVAFENFDMNNIKKAGAIFDGFCIWVTGLEGISRERATACVSRGGGVRYDGPHERVTHVVAAGAAASVAQKALPAVPVLSPMWLIKSVEAGRALDEALFVVDSKPATPVKSTRKPPAETASPMSKRNLALLRRAPLDLPPPQPECNPPADEIVNHYLSQYVPEAAVEGEKTLAMQKPDASNVTLRQKKPNITDDVTNEITDDVTEEIEQIFNGVKIEVQGLDEEAVCEIGAEVAAAGGALVAAGAGGTYVLVPLDFDTDELVTGSADAVTVFWVKDCLSQQELVPIQYYHRPVKVPQWGSGPGPLHGVVASLSTYTGVERAFLDEVAKLLGATTQLRFCRRNTANALASTHLICPEPTGDKYVGALKWGIPAVSGGWLLKCAAEGRRVSERGYLVGDTKAPPSPEARLVDAPQIPVRVEVSKQEDTARDKENEMLPPHGIAVPRRGSLPGREQTPKGKIVNDGEDMSPASRYIAMARQGLLGGDSQETPKRIQDLKDDSRLEGGVRTPPLEDALSTPNLVGLSPTTRRRLQAVKRGEMLSDPIRTPIDPFEKNVETPDSAFGAALRPDSGRLSPDARKRLWRVVNELPERTAATPTTGAGHTPLSEIRNRFLAQFNGDASTPPSEHNLTPRKLHLREEVDTPPTKMPKLSEDHCPGSTSKLTNSDGSKNASSGSSTLPAAVDEQLQRLNAALADRASTQRSRRATRDSIAPVQFPVVESEPGPESQPNTVGWDDTTPVHAHTDANAHIDAPTSTDAQEPAQELTPTQRIKRFMLSSNVDNRIEIIEMIQYLGGKVCEGTELDPEATHLLCSAPGRSEKVLGSIAGGRWVLHPAYVARSRANGSFLSEEDYEWGNPRATCLPTLSNAEQALARAAFRWRSNRAGGTPGPFAGLVALLHVPPAKKRLLARMIVAGDGLVPDDEPPYTNEQVTVCFADIKRYPLSPRDASWLISKRIPVCAPILLSSYLTDELQPVPEKHCLPEFRPK